MAQIQSNNTSYKWRLRIFSVFWKKYKFFFNTDFLLYKQLEELSFELPLEPVFKYRFKIKKKKHSCGSCSLSYILESIIQFNHSIHGAYF